MLALPTAVMHASNQSTDASSPEPRLTLKSQLADLTLVWSWVEALAAQHSISAETQFAIQLCLEEALSNVIRHGYSGQANQSVTVACTVECASTGRRELVFVVEDHGPPFDPLAHPHAGQAPAPASIAELEPGGQGIRLMRSFAHRVAYQRLPNGNRLTLAFVIKQ
jgi:anti-sigma regulatory factor (Ser/Thr protein kinase)